MRSPRQHATQIHVHHNLGRVSTFSCWIMYRIAGAKVAPKPSHSLDSAVQVIVCLTANPPAISPRLDEPTRPQAATSCAMRTAKRSPTFIFARTKPRRDSSANSPMMRQGGSLPFSQVCRNCWEVTQTLNFCFASPSRNSSFAHSRAVLLHRGLGLLIKARTTPETISREAIIARRLRSAY